MHPISSFHAHVYFDATTVAKATRLCKLAVERFPVTMGRVHRRPVGPHPDWSCQLVFAASVFGELVPWLALNREGLVIFIHPETGDDLVDHRDHAIWMGAVRPLNLEIFNKS
jgi:aromatic ring-cleaving dioxygenase